MKTKSPILKVLFIVFFAHLIFSCAKNENINPVENESLLENSIPKPKVTWQFGIGASLWKPSENCLRKIAICKIKAVFVVLDWSQHSVPINFGISENNELILEFINSTDIIDLSGQNYMEISPGDELITIDQGVINYFAQQSIDISSIKLIVGKYDYQIDEDNGNYFISIPFELM